MTSKTLSLNLFRGECRRRIWLYALSLVLFLAIPGSLLMDIDRWLMWGMTKKQIIPNLRYSLSISSSAFLWIAAAIVYAAVCFGYMFSRSRVDMYHSLPIDRKGLFVMHYLSGLFPFIAIDIIVSIMTALVISAKGLSGNGLGGIIFSTCVYSIVLFIMCYSVSVAVLSLCGNLMIGIILNIGLLSAYEMTNMVLRWYKSYCFQTYSGGLGIGTSPWWTVILSPGSAADGLKPLLSDNPGRFILMIVVAVIYTALAILLYSIRPSESAGKAVCYKALRPVIVIPVTILAALAGGIYIVFVSGDMMTAGWYWLLFAGCGILAHVVAEITLQLDFKKAFRHWVELIISLAVAAVIACFFLFDLSGYDRYIPDAKNVKSAALSFDNIDTDISIYDFGDADEDTPNVNFIDRTQYILENMKSENNTAIRQLTELGVASIDPERSVFKRAAKQREINNNGMVSEMDEKYPENDSRQFYYTVRYNLGNGRSVYRSYKSRLSEAFAPAEAVYNSAEYKAAAYQLSDMRGKELFDKITFSDTFYNEVFVLENAVDIDAFIEALDKDLQSMTLSRARDEYPIYQIDSYMKSAEEMGYYSDLLYGYYIYPDYVNTLNFLHSKGMSMESEMIFDPGRVDRIEITDYRAGSDSPGYVNMPVPEPEYTEPVQVLYDSENDWDVIMYICEVAVPEHFAYVNSILKPYEDGMDVNIFYATDKGFIIQNYSRIPKGRVPARVTADIEKAYEEGSPADVSYNTMTLID